MKIKSWRDFYYYQKKSKLLSREAEQFLLGLKNEQEAIDLLVEYNLGLINQIARQNLNRGIELEDLTTAGIIGLIDAINRFDINSGNKLSTFAYYYINNSIKSTIENESRTIRVPAHQYEAQSKINKWQAVSKNQKELCSLTGLSEKQLKNASKAFVQIVPDDDYAALTQSDNHDLEEITINKLISEESFNLLESISPIHKIVIQMSFGFLGEPYSILEMSKELLIPQNEIIKIHNEALDILKVNFK